MFLFRSCQKESSKYVYQTKNKKVQNQYAFDEFPSCKTLPETIQQQQGVIKIKKSSYEELIKQLQKKNQKFIDQEFPPNNQSLGKVQNIDDDNYEWKRISEIIQNPVLLDDHINPSHTASQVLQKCYFLSAMAALAEEESRIKRIFQNQQYSPLGIYKLKLRIHGIIKQIIIDDYIPVNTQGTPLFCHPNKNYFWILLLEKAWAKLKGSYQNIQNGNPAQVFEALTYAPTRILSVNQAEANRDKLWDEIISQTKKVRPICAGTVNQPDLNQEQQNNGLVWGHFYTIICAYQIKTKNSKQWYKIIKLRNPWGRVQWQGKHCQNDDQFWQTIQCKDKDKIWGNMQKADDGIFLMGWKDFCKYFNTIHFCYYDKNPSYQVQTLYPDRKHGNIHVLGIKKQGEYIIQLHQTVKKLDNNNSANKQGVTNPKINRMTIIIMKAKDFQYLKGIFSYDLYDPTLKIDLIPGKYLIYTKIDPIIESNQVDRKQWIYPKKVSLSVYSKYWISQLKLANKSKISLDTPFYNKMFIQHARVNKKKQFDNGNLWISWKQLLQRAGFAYICFGVQITSKHKFLVSFKQKDFNDLNYGLKKPYKGKCQISFQVKPGQQIFVIARVLKNQQVRALEFPPPLDVKIKGLQ